MEDYREQLFDETFENVCGDMKRRRDKDPRFTKEEMEGLLKALRIHHGNDWEGRGEIRDIINEATIAACELVLSEWQNEDK